MLLGGRLRAGIVSALFLLLACTPITPTPGPSVAVSPSSDPCHAGAVTYCVLNPEVVQATIAQTICVSGWTATIRPPVSYTNPLKQQQLTTYTYLHPNDPSWTMSGTEEDHRLPLELGGDPIDPSNLSPEEHSSSSVKDSDESLFKKKVCSGEPLRQAQSEFVTKWLTPYPGYNGGS